MSTNVSAPAKTPSSAKSNISSSGYITFASWRPTAKSRNDPEKPQPLQAIRSTDHRCPSQYPRVQICGFAYIQQLPTLSPLLARKSGVSGRGVDVLEHLGGRSPIKKK